MATEITGGNAQVGTLNRQFIETITNSNNNNNNNNNVTININVVHCTSSHQHQHQEGVSISGGDVPQLMDALKSIVESCGQTSQIVSESTMQTQSEAAVKSDSVPATQTRKREVRKRRGEDVPRQQTEVNIDSVRIVDSDGEVLEPGDAVWINWTHDSLYVGDGYVVYCKKDSQIVVKEKLDLTQLFYKSTPFMWVNVNVFPPEQRVQRALQHIGKPCPVPATQSLDFVCWTSSGLNHEQCLEKGLRLFWNKIHRSSQGK